MDSIDDPRFTKKSHSSKRNWQKLAIYLSSSILLAGIALIIISQFRHPFFPSLQINKSLPVTAQDATDTLISIEPPLVPSQKVISVSYGPFNVSQKAMMPELVLRNVSKPCSNCSITAMQASLINSSSQLPLWPDKGVHLHHFIFHNFAVQDLVCPRYGERFFGSGNEHWTRRWDGGGEYGYKANVEDEWVVVVEIMNDGEWEGEVEVEVMFEVERDRMLKRVRPVWLDATGCGRSDIEVKSTTAPFEYKTPPWTSSVEGTLLDIAAHQHDGGIDMTAYLNDEQLCHSVQFYGTQTTEPHITAAGVCKDAGRIEKGDVLWANARYDPVLHPLVMHDGKPDMVMGSMGIYVGVDEF